MERLRDTEKALEAARKEQALAIKSAESGLKDAEKAHKQAVAAAEDAEEKAQEGNALAACAPYTVFESYVYTPEGTVWLEPSMQARADTSGNLQVEHHPSAATAVCCGCWPALIFQKKETHDTRQLFISLSGPGIASVAAVPPKMEEKARQFVATFNAVAPNGPAARLERQRVIDEAQRFTEAVRSDRSTIEDALRNVDRAKSSTEAIRVAEQALAVVEADTAEVDAARERLRKLES